MADMLTESNEGDKHKDLRPSEIRRSEKCVQNATEAIKCFLNRFDVMIEIKFIVFLQGHQQLMK